MKNFKWTALIVVCIAFAKANTLQAQENFKAIAHYIVQTKIDLKDDEDKEKEAKDEAEDARTSEIMAKLREAMAKGNQQEYVMEITPTESSYNKVVELAKPKKAGEISVSFTVNNGSTSSVYKDLKEQKYYKEDEIMGKEFLIVDDIPSYAWQPVNETKKIGNYTCYKATYTPVLTEEEKKEQEEKMEKASQGSLLAMIPEQDRTITAWYTPEIPISNGPGEYQGLPGLILEVQEANTVLLCTKIEINPEKDLDMKKPKSGKKINQKDFDELREKKMQERMERNGNKGFIITRTTSN
ncbi:GLPGLI family protein [Nonlabens agnitus]|uniref:GLPGLI family protein n=1 Tax=Nonlabens agnitus TaxID=870484 RepID=A0A2S9WVR0_9FLAO|nr:GLPGLI family protein [Nonlabens agnitus]PRP67446.1 hypothetical protein BST86_10250 [Nonlabens agnitus]